MPRKALPTLSMSTLLAFAGFAAISTACAEGAPLPIQRAIREHAVANSQFGRSLAASISNAAFARGARRGGEGRDSAGRARNGVSGGHMGNFGGDLVGGSLAWPFYPYYNYCTRHPGDPNC